MHQWLRINLQTNSRCYYPHIRNSSRMQKLTQEENFLINLPDFLQVGEKQYCGAGHLLPVPLCFLDSLNQLYGLYSIGSNEEKAQRWSLQAFKIYGCCFRVTALLEFFEQALACFIVPRSNICSIIVAFLKYHRTLDCYIKECDHQVTSQ